MEKLKEVIRKFKRHKSPGPDLIPMEIFKEMTDENLEEIRGLLNLWWAEEAIPEEVLQARVALI
eukprot:4283832-Karenia_brevis.AAC.1